MYILQMPNICVHVVPTAHKPTMLPIFWILKPTQLQLCVAKAVCSAQVFPKAKHAICRMYAVHVMWCMEHLLLPNCQYTIVPTGLQLVIHFDNRQRQ